MNKASERYNIKVEIPISVILETIFSDDNKDVETLCRWAKKYGFVDLEDKYYKLQEDYTKQSFYIWLSKNERKQYDYEDYLLNKIEQLEKENKQLKEKVDYLKNKCENKDKWCQLIVDIGYDYDGYVRSDNLMKLMDELVKYAIWSRDDHDYDAFQEDGKNE